MLGIFSENLDCICILYNTLCSKLNVFRLQPYAYKNRIMSRSLRLLPLEVLGFSTTFSLASALLFPALSLLTTWSEDLITEFLIRLTVGSVSVLAKHRKHTHKWCLLTGSPSTLQQYYMVIMNLGLNLHLEHLSLNSF